MRFPAITLSIAAASLITYLVPGLADLFVYDRYGVLDGQVWRLVTAPLVHFSASHLFWNLLVFTVAGCVTELSGYRRFEFVCLPAVVLPGLLFLAIDPDLHRYGGLSALAIAATAYLCLCRAQQTRGGRGLWIAILALLLAKILVECVIGEPIFAQSAGVFFRNLPAAHAVGVAAAAVAFVRQRRNLWKCNSIFPGAQMTAEARRHL